METNTIQEAVGTPASNSQTLVWVTLNLGHAILSFKNLEKTFLTKLFERYKNA